MVLNEMRGVIPSQKEALCYIFDSLDKTVDLIATISDEYKGKVVALLYKYLSARMLSNYYAASVI